MIYYFLLHSFAASDMMKSNILQRAMADRSAVAQQATADLSVQLYLIIKVKNVPTVISTLNKEGRSRNKRNSIRPERPWQRKTHGEQKQGIQRGEKDGVRVGRSSSRSTVQLQKCLAQNSCKSKPLRHFE